MTASFGIWLRTIEMSVTDSCVPFSQWCEITRKKITEIITFLKHVPVIMDLTEFLRILFLYFKTWNGQNTFEDGLFK